MASLTGKEALDFHKKIKAEEISRRDKTLAEAKKLAAVSGKETFDLKHLATLCDTSQAGLLSDEAEQFIIYEYQYYVENHAVQNLGEFADLINRVSLWS